VGAECQGAEIDKVARLQISQELGHNRIEITNCYLGSNS
jgi:hypothetical protein